MSQWSSRLGAHFDTSRRTDKPTGEIRGKNFARNLDLQKFPTRFMKSDKPVFEVASIK